MSIDTATSPFIPASLLLEDIGAWPSDIAELDGDTSVLDRVGVRDVGIVETAAQTTARFTVIFQGDLSLTIPGLAGISLVFGSNGTQTEFDIEVDLQEPRAVRLVDVSIALRFSSSLLKPVRMTNGGFEPDPTRSHVQIGVTGSIIVGDEGLRVEGMNELSLEPCMISDSGIVIEASTVLLDLSRDSSIPQAQEAGLPQSWTGVFIEEAAMHLPPELGSAVPDGLGFQNCFIGAGGFTGKVELSEDPGFVGFIGSAEFVLRTFALEFRQNAFLRSEVRGELTLPFFDEPVDVEIGFSANGLFLLRLSEATGIAELRKPGLLAMQVNAITFTVGGGTFVASLSGNIRPEVGGLQWPSFQVKELAIDSEGNVRLEGGWLDLREQYGFDFNGFQMEITKLGFGKTDDGGKWIGFSGGLKLAEGLPAGASVEGLRVTWYEDGREPKLTFNGVGVEFEVPEVLSFEGAVSYSGPVEVSVPGGTETIERFDGAIKLNLKSLNMRVDGTLVVGSASGARGSYNFFAVYVGAELPAGIPLFSTGLALYGMAGLFALQMEPNRRPNEGWYENPDRSPGWYKRRERGVTDLVDKWAPAPGSVAFGAGVTVGTLPDNGTTFHGKLLFLMVLPGPILLLEGRGDLLKERAELDKKGAPTSEPLFRALAVLDNRAGNLTVGLDAQYRYAGGGELIDIRGGVEAFFDFRNADAWHLYLGEKDPRERRIRARALSLFEANAYFMLDARRLAMGAWIGFDGRWTFGPLSVTLEAWIDGNAVLSFKPPQFHGDLWAHGKVELKVFGFGLGLTVDARIAADVFKPFHLLGDFSVKLDLPWPLPDPGATVRLEWGPQRVMPPLPLPLKEIAVEHFKVTTSWPLPRNTLLRPNYDPNGDGFLDAPAGPVEPPDPTTLPAVPLDARPHLTFGRHVNDHALVGVNAQPDVWERIGDPASGQGPVKVRYALERVALEKSTDNGWEAVAWSPNNDPDTKLFGSWAPVPPLPGVEASATGGGVVAQTKLWLWSKTPFDYSRHSGRAWDEWFTDRLIVSNQEYPCVGVDPERETCCGFETIDLDPALRSPWRCPGASGITLSWLAPESQPVPITVLDPPVDGLDRALCLPTGLPDEGFNEITIELPQPSEAVNITLEGIGGFEARGYGANGELLAHATNSAGTVARLRLELRHPGLARVVVGPAIFIGLVGAASASFDRFCLLRVCATREGTESCCDFRGVDPPERPISLPWRCPEHQEITFGTPDPQYGRCVARLLPAPVAGQSRALCFRVIGAEIWADIAVVELEEPVRALKLILTDATETISATGYDAAGNPYDPVWSTPGQPQITVAGEEIKRVVLAGNPDREICIAEVCVVGVEDLNKHLRNELVRWTQEDYVLEPHTTYRLATVTAIEAQGEGELAGRSKSETIREFAYFRTEGPPGTQQRQPEGEELLQPTSGLEDLTRYVKNTVPDAIRAPGEKPALPRPVYRGYDVGVRFNENYVELMYRLAGRDLGLYLYDNNDRPVRDAEGRLISLPNRWGQAEEATLTESEERWMYLLERSGCVPAESMPAEVVSDTTLVSAAEGQVLEADTPYEARLVPLLLHETFSQGLSPGWRAIEGTLSDWEIRGHATLKGSNATASGAAVSLDGSPDLSRVDPAFDFIVLAGDASRPFGRYRIVAVDNAAKRVTVDGTPQLDPSPSRWEIPALGAVVAKEAIQTTLLRDGSGAWADYRVSALVRSMDDHPVGLAFRYREDNDDHYRFTMGHGDVSPSRLRLEKWVGGYVSELDEAEFEHQPNRDYLLTVEAIGSVLRTYQDGALIFERTDDAIGGGGIGLFSAGSAGARFADVRVDDLGGASPAYSFGFTTSRFADFFHHLHSFQDECWRAELGPGVDIAAAADASVPLAAPPPAPPPTEAESRAYETLTREVLGSAAAQDPARVEVTRVEKDDEALAFLVRSPEPIDWERTSTEVLRADRQVPVPSPPGDLKLTEVSFGTSQANEESVRLLLREAAELTGRRIEYRTPLLDEPFDGPPDRWSFEDKGDQDAPSQWDTLAGELRQTSGIHGGGAASPEKPGTLALAGDAAWTDYSLSVRLRSDDTGGDIGAVFRYQDEQNYYRFSMGRTPGSRRLIRKWDGTVSTLWEDAQAYVPGREYALTLECVGARLQGYLDDALIFDVEDASLQHGRIGLYCWRNPAASFAEVRIVPTEWTPFYTFGEEARLPVGACVRVYSGNASFAPPEGHGVIRRFAASGADGGQLRLNAEGGAELRLASPGGGIGQTRYFLPGDAYTPVSDVRVLRKADGTGFIILASDPSPAGTPFTNGQYRLEMAYRRDNRVAYPDSLVLSEAGTTADERVAIDVPWRVR